MQAIYDVVGDKIQEIFDAQGVAIAILDEATGLVSFPYLIERGERLRPEPTAVGPGFTKQVLETREPLLINENLAAEGERYGSFVMAGEMPKSVLCVPLVSGGRASGVISLDNFDREHAFSESDQRLLMTLAGSLSVALENARLLHETRQRNAELALINSVQEALAGELEMQAIYDVVGDKIQEIFDAQVVDIGIVRRRRGGDRLPVHDRARRTLPDEPTPLERFYVARPRDEGADTHQRGRAGRARARRQPSRSSASPKSARARAPSSSGGRATGRHLAPEHRPRACLHRDRRRGC